MYQIAHILYSGDLTQIKAKLEVAHVTADQHSKLNTLPVQVQIKSVISEQF
jgi:hypothetical protein